MFSANLKLFSSLTDSINFKFISLGWGFWYQWYAYNDRQLPGFPAFSIQTIHVILWINFDGVNFLLKSVFCFDLFHNNLWGTFLWRWGKLIFYVALQKSQARVTKRILDFFCILSIFIITACFVQEKCCTKWNVQNKTLWFVRIFVIVSLFDSATFQY